MIAKPSPVSVYANAHHLPTEQAVLAVLLDGRYPGAVSLVREICPTRDYFHARDHQVLIHVCFHLADLGKRIDTLTVVQALSQLSHADYWEHQRVRLDEGISPGDAMIKAITPMRLGEISEAGASFATLKANCETLAQYWTQRQMIDALLSCQDALQATNGSQKAPEVGAKAILTLSALSGQADGTQTLSQAMERAMVRHDAASQQGDVRQASWGLPILDKSVPLRPGRMVVLAAQPGHGKTSLALQAVLASATTLGSGSVGMVSLEMSAEELGTILLARELKASSRTIETGYLDADRRQAADEVIAEWGKTDVYLRSSSTTCTIDAVSAWIRQRHIRSQGKLTLVVLDYLQLIDPKGNQRELEKLTEATRTLKRLCLELRICLLVLSQITREGGKAERDAKGALKGNPEPRMQDLRGSGTIEQDADAVVFIWPAIDVRGDVLPCVFKVAKNRAGARPDPIQAIFERANGQVFRSLETVAADPADSDRSHHRHEPTPTEDLYAGENAG